MSDLIKMPKSKFIRIMCKKCRKDQVVYSKPASLVKCLSCGEELLIPRGGQAVIKGKVLEFLG